MKIHKNTLFIVAGAVAFLVVAGLAWNYTEAIKAKNNLELQKLRSSEFLKREELEQGRAEAEEKQRLEQAKLNRQLEEDCQDQIATLRLRYNNVEGGGYDAYNEYCKVSYTDSEGYLQSGDANSMVSADAKTPEESPGYKRLFEEELADIIKTEE